MPSSFDEFVAKEKELRSLHNNWPDPDGLRANSAENNWYVIGSFGYDGLNGTIHKKRNVDGSHKFVYTPRLLIISLYNRLKEYGLDEDLHTLYKICIVDRIRGLLDLHQEIGELNVREFLDIPIDQQLDSIQLPHQYEHRI